MSYFGNSVTEIYMTQEDYKTSSHLCTLLSNPYIYVREWIKDTFHRSLLATPDCAIFISRLAITDNIDRHNDLFGPVEIMFSFLLLFFFFQTGFQPGSKPVELFLGFFYPRNV